MKNPWEEISLSDYENHMSLNSVKQLQTMNRRMKTQLETFPVDTAMILGIAGGNGLEHVNTEKYKVVYAVDINADYLEAVKVRYGNLGSTLKCLHLDLINEKDKLPQADLVIANLLIEYIGYKVFKDAVIRVSPLYVSCIIQINNSEDTWVSDSPYLHSFDGLDTVHHQMAESELTGSLDDAGYEKISENRDILPNGKALLCIDYQKKHF